MHTPGPWKLSGHEYPSAARGITVYCAQGVNIGTVCTTPYSGKGARAADYARVAAANARLIAAAPDLLEDLLKAQQAINDYIAAHQGDPGAPDEATAYNALTRFHAPSLAKAKG